MNEEQRQQKYEEYRKKVKAGTPLRDAERKEWVELQEEFNNPKVQEAKEDAGEDVASENVLPTVGNDSTNVTNKRGRKRTKFKTE